MVRLRRRAKQLLVVVGLLLVVGAAIAYRSLSGSDQAQLSAGVLPVRVYDNASGDHAGIPPELCPPGPCSL